MTMLLNSARATIVASAFLGAPASSAFAGGMVWSGELADAPGELVVPIADRNVINRHPGVGGGRVVNPRPGPTVGVAEATTSLKCGDTVYTVYVDGGKCKAGKTAATCKGGKDRASASCENGCGTSTGNGGCNIKRRRP